MRVRLFLIALIAAVFLLTGCDSDRPTFYVWFYLTDQTVCTAGEILYGDAYTYDGENQNFTYQWTVTGGTVEDASNYVTTWSAPDVPGTYYITLKVSGDEEEVVITKKIEVFSSPMSVTSLKIEKDEFENKQITMSLKNETSSKTIIAFKAKIALWDVFNERIWTPPYLDDEFLECYFDDINVKPGETVQVLQKNIYSDFVKAKAFVYQVQYSDGTGWKVEGWSEY